MAIAILRHDLYDVDKAIAGIVVYGAASAALLAIYASASFAGGLFLGPGSPASAAAATAVCAMALMPLLADPSDRRPAAVSPSAGGAAGDR